MSVQKTDIKHRSNLVLAGVFGRLLENRAAPASGSCVTVWVQQATNHVAAWVVVGLVVGYLGRESVGPGIIATASNMIAGAIVLPVVGLPMLILGAEGGRPFSEDLSGRFSEPWQHSLPLPTPTLAS